MGWETVEIDGQRTTQWVVPEDVGGWALNSVGAGEAGNVVIAGYQMYGNAVFAALALGEVEPGQEILLTDEAGAEFVYRVVEVAEPLPLLGATAEEQVLANAYIAPTTDARLTLVTGWPAATTTHRIFVVAELAADAQ
jgi:sortase (surface protein transpeptidase)